ncbi:hypothetical protein N182_25660 [Sinorhizobium sp. GL2]|nr:hypothetical protein N182_25660 [Sinorhizobium sp. GL2]
MVFPNLIVLEKRTVRAENTAFRKRCNDFLWLARGALPALHPLNMAGYGQAPTTMKVEDYS